jgi:hypothetical protein
MMMILDNNTKACIRDIKKERLDAPAADLRQNQMAALSYY